MAAWYFGKFVFGLTGMVYFYLTYLQKKKSTVCVCPLIKEHLQRGGQGNVEFCPDHNSDVTVKKDCGTSNHSLVAVLDQSHQTQPQSVSATTMTMTAVQQPVYPPTLAVVHRKPKLQQQPVHQKPKLKQQPVHQKPKSQPVPRKLQFQNPNQHHRLPVHDAVVHVEPVNQFEQFVESDKVVIKKLIEQQMKGPRCSCNKLRTKKTRKRRSTTTNLENFSNVCRDTDIDSVEQDFRKTLMDLDRLNRTFSAIPRNIQKSKRKNVTQPIAWWHAKTSSICSKDSAIFSSTMKAHNPVKHYSSKNYSIRRSNHDRQVNGILRQAC